MTAFYNQGPYGASHYSQGNIWTAIGELPIVFSFDGTLANPIMCRGSIAITVSLAGEMTTDYAISGGFALEFVFDGHFQATYAALGNLPILVGFNGAPGAGPLWQADPLCPLTPWAPSELCNG